MTLKEIKEDVKNFDFKIGKEEGRKEEKKEAETEKGIKEGDFKGKNLNKVGIRGASDTNAIDTLDMSFANIPAGGELKIDLAEEYENVKALKIKFTSKSGPFKFKINDSDKEYESKKLKDDVEIFELDEPIDGNCVCIKPTGDNGAQIVDVQVFVEGDPNKRKNFDNRNPPAPKKNGEKKGNGDKK